MKTNEITLWGLTAFTINFSCIFFFWIIGALTYAATKDGDTAFVVACVVSGLVSFIVGSYIAIIEHNKGKE